jgi:hypothetical protein
MKKITLLTAILLLFANSAWSLYVWDSSWVDVGNQDSFVAAGTSSDVGVPNDVNELAWINRMAGTAYLLADYTK